MCGLSGYAGIENSEARFKLVGSLGRRIDSRGQAMAGFVASNDEDFFFARKQGSWHAANDEWIMTAAHGDLCMMHSRAPGYSDPVTNAHPFPIVRDDKVVLYGAHNGYLNDADESCKAHGRELTVDSKELFELIADGESLQDHEGWGVIEWIEETNRRQVKITKISADGELEVVSVKGGGVVWASTWQILKYGLDAAGLEVDEHIDVDEVGRVYLIDKDGCRPSEQTGFCTSNKRWG